MNVLSLDDWAYSLLNTINPKLMDDEEVDLRQVKTWIIDTRAIFLKNLLNTRKGIESNLVQTIANEPVEYVSTSGKDKIFRTKNTIPPFVMLDSGPAISRIGSTNSLEPSFKLFSNTAEVPFSGHGRFNKYSVFAYLDGDRIFLKTKDPLFIIGINSEINISAVFVDPRDLSEYKDENGKPAFSDRYSNFPMDRETKTYIENQIKQSKFAFTEQSIPDNVNDSQDNSEDKMMRGDGR